MHQNITMSVTRLLGSLITLALLTFSAPVLASDDIVIGFGAIGLYARMNDTNWLRLNPASPTQVVTGDMDGNGEDDVIAAFDFGTYVKYNLGPWQLLHKTTPQDMSVGDLDNNGQDDVVIDFGGIGLYARMNNTSWLRLNPASPTQVVTGDVDGNGEDDVIAAFDFGTFIKYNLGPWQRLHKSTAEAMAVGDLDDSGQDDVVIDFGAGIGLYARMNDTSWLKLYNGSPDLITTGDIDGNGADDVVATFGSSFGGSWVKLNLGGWSKLSALAADDIVTGNVNGTGSDDIVASFATSIGGVYVKRDQGSWSLLNNSNPHSIAVGNLDGSPTFIGDVAIMSELLDSAQGGGVGAWGTDSDAFQVLPQFEYEKISYDIATDTLIFEDVVYDYATQTFVPFTGGSDDLWLKADGSWVANSQTVTAVLTANNGDGSMTVSIRDSSDDAELARFRVSARTVDISGEPMVNHLDADWAAAMIDPTAIFGGGAQQVSGFTGEVLVDDYELEVDTSCEINEPARFALLNGNCNGVLVMATNIFSTTLDQLISTVDWVDLDDGSEIGLVAVFASFNASNSTVLMAELVNSGNTVNYYVRDFSINVTDEDRVRLVLSDLDGWVRNTSIHTTDMIRFTVPGSLAAQFPDLSDNEIDRRHGYVVHNGFVRDGFLELVGDISEDEDPSYNGIAIDQVLANFSSPAAPDITPLVGTWVAALPSFNGDPSVIHVFANGFFEASGTCGLDGTTGMEHGTLTWNSVTGAFDVNTSVSTRGLCSAALGAANGNMVAVTGDVLTQTVVGFGDVIYNRIPNTTNPLIGSWVLGDITAPGVAHAILTILDDTTFTLSQNCVTDGVAGFEYGTYTWNQGGSNVLTGNLSIDTNGGCGLHDNTGMVYSGYTLTVSGVILTVISGGDTLVFTRHSSSSDGTVTDSQTGLMWQKGENDVVNWFQAMGIADLTFNPGFDDVCGSLDLAGNTDWRVPTRRELVTIVDYAESRPAIDVLKFPGATYGNYWSSVGHVPNSNLAWPIYFVDGSSYPDWANKGSLFRVRCVRGPTSLTPSYVDNSDGTVTESTLTLMWQSQPDGTPRIWVDAISYCNAFVLAGHSDWRLPFVDELLFITDQTRFLPAIDITFFASFDSYYWSSTEIARNPAEAWPVLFTDGSMPNYVHFKSTAHHVRCVRDI